MKKQALLLLLCSSPALADWAEVDSLNRSLADKINRGNTELGISDKSLSNAAYFPRVAPSGNAASSPSPIPVLSPPPPSHVVAPTPSKPLPIPNVGIAPATPTPSAVTLPLPSPSPSPTSHVVPTPATIPSPSPSPVICSFVTPLGTAVNNLPDGESCNGNYKEVHTTSDCPGGRVYYTQLRCTYTCVAGTVIVSGGNACTIGTINGSTCSGTVANAPYSSETCTGFVTRTPAP